MRPRHRPRAHAPVDRGGSARRVICGALVAAGLGGGLVACSDPDPDPPPAPPGSLATAQSALPVTSGTTGPAADSLRACREVVTALRALPRYFPAAGDPLSREGLDAVMSAEQVLARDRAGLSSKAQTAVEGLNLALNDVVIGAQGTAAATIIREAIHGLERACDLAPVPVQSPPPRPASQSSADARRDGVLPAVAALPFTGRVGVLSQAVATEGVWVVSRMPGNPVLALGNADGRYGRDFVNTAEYGELLLLDPTMSRIRRAYPFPGLPPQTLLLRPDALYCARQGDGGLPDSMLCRVDRTSLRARVRVFPVEETRQVPVPIDTWVVDPSPAPAVLGRLTVCGEHVCTTGPDGTRRLNPVTLSLR